MNDLPDPIETEYYDGEGFEHRRSHEQLTAELVEKYNRLIAYLKAREDNL